MPTFSFINDFGAIGYVVYTAVLTLVGIVIYRKVDSWRKRQSVKKEGQN